MSKNGDSDVDSLAVSDYTAVCATTTAPIVSGTSVVGSDGKFNISIAANGQPVSCYLTNSSGDKAADFLIEDTSNKDLNGNSDRSTTMIPKGNINMDAITFDAATGEVTIPKTAIASSINSTFTAGSVYDPTGNWAISAVDFTLPTGVDSVCASGDNNCNGPPDGQVLYMKRWAGTKTADSSTIYGLQVWDSQSAYTSCGSKIGLSTAQKTDIGVDFSANGSADAEFNFATSATFTDDVLSATSSPTLTDNWKMSTAKLMYNFNPNCAPADVTIGGVTYSNAWKCGPDNSGYYQVSLGGGCTVTSTGKPAEINDWSGMTCNTTTDTHNVSTSECTGTKTVNSASVGVTCRNKWAEVNGSGTVLANGSFHWADMTASDLASGTFCSAIGTGTTALQLATLRCYADYYYRSGLSDEDSICLPRVDMDWSATTAADFIQKDFRPNGMVFFEQFKPFADGTGGSMITRQEHYEGVQLAGGNSWVNCAVIDTGALSIKKISATKLLATYQSSIVTSSTSKPACQAKFTGQKKTFVFYLTAQ